LNSGGKSAAGSGLVLGVKLQLFLWFSPPSGRISVVGISVQDANWSFLDETM